MSEEQKCETGCQHFCGGEIKHHKDCVFYPESLSEMYDQQQAKHKEELKKAFDAGVTSDIMYFPEQHEEEAFIKWYKEYHDNKE